MKSRSGIAMILAIFLIGFVALTLAGLGETLTTQIQRTVRARQDAQLRQLLLAGAEIAQVRLNVGLALDAPIELPAILRAQDATLQLKSSDDADEKRVEALAKFEGVSLSEELSFGQTSGHWQMIDAQLGQ
jgi:type II secretory pathway component PulK